MAPSDRFETALLCSPFVRLFDDDGGVCRWRGRDTSADCAGSPRSGPRGARGRRKLRKVPRPGSGAVVRQVPDLPQAHRRPNRAEGRRPQGGDRRLQCLPRGASRGRRRSAADRHPELQPRRRNRLPSRKQAYKAGRELFGLPQEALVSGCAPGLRVLPQGRPQERGGHRLHEVSLDGRGVQGRAHGLRPHQGRVPVDRRSPTRRVRKMPRRRCPSRPPLRQVLLVPQDTAPQRAGAVVHGVPQHRLLDHAYRSSTGGPASPSPAHTSRWRARRATRLA